VEASKRAALLVQPKRGHHAVLLQMPLKQEWHRPSRGDSINVHNPFQTFGEYLLAVRNACLPGAQRDPRLELRGVGGALGASEAVPADGGFLLQPDFVRPLVERMYLTGAVLSRCMEFPISNKSNAIAFPQFDESARTDGARMGGFRAYWANEADTATSSKPKFSRGEIVASKIIGLAYCTEELFQDTAALEIFVSMGLAKELAFRLEDALINGDGAGKPLGVMKAGAMVTMAKQSGQAAGTIVSSNVTDMWRTMWAPSRRTAVWLAHPDAEAELITLTAAVGTGGAPLPLYQATQDPENQPYNLMLGRPVIPMEQTQVPGTPGDLIFVDWARYALAMREARADVSMHVQFLTEQVAFRFVLRVGGQPIDARPITPFTGTNQVSPFVCLAQR
jgi:HK97 family phage major capsid protein